MSIVCYDNSVSLSTLEYCVKINDHGVKRIRGFAFMRYIDLLLTVTLKTTLTVNSALF